MVIHYIEYVYLMPYVYSFCPIFQALRLFPALRLFQTLEYIDAQRRLNPKKKQNEFSSYAIPDIISLWDDQSLNKKTQDMASLVQKKKSLICAWPKEGLIQQNQMSFLAMQVFVKFHS